MPNIVYLEVYSVSNEQGEFCLVKLPLVSFITYSVFKFSAPADVSLNFVIVDPIKQEDVLVLHCKDTVNFVDKSQVPWQVASCVLPVVIYDDTVITGLCAVARHITKFRSSTSSSLEHEEGLLGFRKGCLQAPNEVSIWTKFCEVDLIKSVQEIFLSKVLYEIPKNLVRFEHHLSKPVRVHNVYKLAREMKKEGLIQNNHTDNTQEVNPESAEKPRVPKTRKWKSNAKKELQVDSSTKIEDLDIIHQFAEGPFLTLADLVLLPSYHIMINSIGTTIFESLLPLTSKWYQNLMQLHELEAVVHLLKELEIKIITIEELKVPSTENVSMYKCDPKRHNPKRRLFTKEDDIVNALSILVEGMELAVHNHEFENGIDWNSIPDGANPTAGHLPDARMGRKSQQLENLALAVLKISKDGDLIVDFCSGSGHLGILLAHLLPKCTILLLENKEQSLLLARKRVHDMGLKNVYFFQCNLDFFIGKFNIGIALHACGIASDLVLDKCLNANAKFVLCPCCYGSLHATDRLVYPRSNIFKKVSIDQYLCIGHAADQTHEDHPLTVRGAKCMAVIDSDRARFAEEFGYKVTLSRLKPLTCTPKNDLLVGVPA